MEINPQDFLLFLNGVILSQHQAEISCSNWDLHGQSLVSSFISAAQHLSLYATISGHSYQLALEFPTYRSELEHVIAVLKLNGSLTSSKPFLNQVSVVNIPFVPALENDNGQKEAYEQIQNLISSVVVPYFDSTLQSDTDDTLDSSSQAWIGTKRKLNELAISLAYLRQRVQVPELLTSVPKNVREVLKNLQDLPESELPSDSDLLNELTRIVHGWIRLVQSITNLAENKLESISLLDEVQFWKSLEAGILSLHSQLKSPEVETAMRILNSAKRFQVSIAFRNNVDLEDSLNETKSFNTLLRDLPLEEIVYKKESPLSIKSYEMNIDILFQHLKRWKGSGSFPIPRMLHLMSQIVSEIVENLSHIFASLNLFFLPNDEFEATINLQILPLLTKIESNIKFMENIIRELIRKRLESFFTAKIKQDGLLSIREKISSIVTLRDSYDQIQKTFKLLCDTSSYLDDLTIAYAKHCASSPIFDLSREGISSWRMDQNAYSQVRSRLERHLTALVHSLLDECASFSEYCGVFDSFVDEDGLIPSLIILLVDDNHKLKILDLAHNEIVTILSAHKTVPQDPKLDNFDLVSNAVVFERELASQSKFIFYISKLEAIIGHTWNKYSVGIKISELVMDFMSLLDLRRIFRDWKKNEKQILDLLNSNSPMLHLESCPGNRGEVRIVQNDSDAVFLMLDEAKKFIACNFNLTAALVTNLDRLLKAEPYVKTLGEHLKLFQTSVQIASEKTVFGSNCGFLLKERVKDCSLALKKILEFSWSNLFSELSVFTVLDSKKEMSFPAMHSIIAFQLDVQNLNVQLNILYRSYDYIHKICFSQLRECKYDLSAIEAVVNLIRLELATLKRENLCGFDCFVTSLNTQIASLLEAKCLDELNNFTRKLARTEVLSILGVHDLSIDGDFIAIHPSIELSKESIIQSINDVIGVALKTDFIESAEPFDIEFSSELSTAGVTCLQQVDSVIDEAFEYGKMWNKFYLTLRKEPESIFTVQTDPVRNITNCLNSVNEVLDCFGILNPLRAYHDIKGTIRFRFDSIQYRVIDFYEEFKAKLLKEFRHRVTRTGTEILDQISTAEKKMSRTFDFNAENNKLFSYLANILELEASIRTWATYLSLHNQCQILLRKQGHFFEDNWIHAEQLQSKLANVKILWESRDESMNSHKELIILKVKSEWEASKIALENLLSDWKKLNPSSPGLEPYDALTAIVRFQSLLDELNLRFDTLFQLGKRFGLELSAIRKDDLLQEVISLKEIWSELHQVWANLNKSRNQPWATTEARKIREDLKEVMKQLKLCSPIVRLYSAFALLEKQINNLLLTIPMIFELKSEAMKERHWKRIFQLVCFKIVPLDKLSVGDVLSLNFQAHETTVRGVIDQANGEKLVEDGIEEINEEWALIVFETFQFDKTCRLIRNWKSLFDQCLTSLATLASIKNSIHSKPFETIIENLESKITDLMNILNVWVEVQSHWIYLKGVFGSNNEVKSSLPLESTRFLNLSLEFHAILKRALNVGLVMDVLQIKNIGESFSKIYESLKNTKKGLFEYLDTQRELFPRFYFVGNDDLLEILGCSSNFTLLNRHINLMFAGIGYLVLDQSKSQVEGVASPQGEILILKSPLSLGGLHSLADWMTKLELEIKRSVAKCIEDCFKTISEFSYNEESLVQCLSNLLKNVPLQATIVSFQLQYSEYIVDIQDNSRIKGYSENLTILLLALRRLIPTSNLLSISKLQSLIIELLHQKDSIEKLMVADLVEREAIINFLQLYFLDLTVPDVLHRLKIRQGRFEFFYGYEYQGIIERLAVTPLVQDCFLAMTQAMSQKKGGSPFGPAGTGKTECIKALGSNFGRMVMVFCCDETFDFQSMGRIMLGICKVGCWACFDEFNRLDPKILSALSSSIELIGSGLQESDQVIELNEKHIRVHPDTGIYITMNPDYSGRNELPENLKRLFRAFAMDKPDSILIAETILSSHGFEDSKGAAQILFRLFSKFVQNLSKQTHYDFGLRALKNVLNLCGAQKRKTAINEAAILINSLKTIISPKLTGEDNNEFEALISLEFSPASFGQEEQSSLRVIVENSLNGRDLQASAEFVNKVLQVIKVLRSYQGFMLLGHAGCGKSTLIDLALNAISEEEGIAYEKITIDSKVVQKELLFGSLDSATREWTDGLFTRCIRGVIHDLKGEQNKIIWIVFDGDIDPEWAENLNSVLDDNKILTLSNGERLKIPSNVRLVFEVDNLKAATLATISRCGMVWVDKSLIEKSDLIISFSNSFMLSRTERVNNIDDLLRREATRIFYSFLSETIQKILSSGLLDLLESRSKQFSHIMSFLSQRNLCSLFSYLAIYCDEVEEFASREEAKFSQEEFVLKALILSLAWAYSGDCSPSERQEFAMFLSQLPVFTQMELPENFMECHFEDFSLNLISSSSKVVNTDLEPHQVLNQALVIPTIDTMVHESIIKGVLDRHKPLILCGPPGSGKTMTLLRSLRDLPDFEFISLNFSKDTSAETLIAALEHHCGYKNTITGCVLAPKIVGKWIVVFCDEINLPYSDKYGSLRTISFLRQLIEQGGFWRPRDLKWITLQNIQFVGACNDPNDPGRNALSERFMRHTVVLKIDHPSEAGLNQIYKTFNSASLKCAPNLRHFSTALTNAMIDVYKQTRTHLTSTQKLHYIYSPRELTRWSRGILRTLLADTCDSIELLIQIWYHEALRLFHDRLADAEEKKWCKEMLIDSARKHFPMPNIDSVLQGHLLFTSWLTGRYQRVDEKELLKFLKDRFRVFSEEELNVNIIIHQDMLDHVLRIDRVLRQPQGHMMLVGTSSSGKSTLVRFVSWMNGLKFAQLQVHSAYTIKEFEAALRKILISCAKGTRICFLIDESCVLETSFIERMNSLLANSEIPGLFDGEDIDSLYSLCASESASQGILLETHDEIHDWFTKQVSENLHVVFTVSDITSEVNSELLTSPALFNRCVINWMGNWSSSALNEVAHSLLSTAALDKSEYSVPKSLQQHPENQILNYRDAVVNVLVTIHRRAMKLDRMNYPSKFIQLTLVALQLFIKGQIELEENQRCIGTGLEKLQEAALEVSKTEKLLSEKELVLTSKINQAKQMLNRMILDQNEAERKKEFSEDAQIEIQKQENEILKRREFVLKSLEAVEPAVLAAQRGVQNIKKQHLTEIRSMSNPPAAVKMTMESVCILLGYLVSSWREVQLIVRKDDFITSIVGFDSEKHLSTEMKEFMMQNYLSRSDFNFETVNRASQACGPLVQWVIAQLQYFSILEKIEPLRLEVNALEESATKSKARLIAIGQMIEELEDSIEKFKNEYSELIGQVENTKIELGLIKQKVARSKKLIAGLTDERLRWQESIKLFKKSRDELAGNAILGATFATYCGALSLKERVKLTQECKAILHNHDIQFNSGLVLTSLLSSEVSSQTQILNDLLRENLAIQAWARVPMIVDPLNEFKDSLSVASEDKHKTMSFLDASFLRSFEDSLRFGGNLILENAEYYNPVMNSFIRNDFLIRGGQKTIQLGDRATVVLSECSVTLYTKDERVNIQSFLESRVTVLNFSVSEGNLENSVLNSILSRVSPDLYSQRADIISIQGDYNSKTLKIRQELLDVLNECKGTMIDNDFVFDTLEKLKLQASEIDSKMTRACATLLEVDEKRSTFRATAVHVRKIYQLLLKISMFDPFYNFSFEMFFETFTKSLPDLAMNFEVAKITSNFFQNIIESFALCFKRFDRIAFVICLAMTYGKDQYKRPFEKGIELILSFFRNGFDEDGWLNYLKSFFHEIAKEVAPETWRLVMKNNDSPVLKVILSLFDIFVGESDTMVSLDTLVECSEDILNVNDKVSLLDLDWFRHLQHKKSPILLCVSKNYDPSFKIRTAAKLAGTSFVEISMGSKEAGLAATKSIEEATIEGNWVLLQNVHLSTHWLPDLVRLISGLNLLKGFKLFMSCSLNPQNIPNALVNMSTVITIEEQTNFRITLLDSFNGLVGKDEKNFQRYVWFLVSFYYALIQERLKYVPLSFSRYYDINESDLEAIAFMVRQIFRDTSIDSGASFPWSEVAYRVGHVLIGGKMSADTDSEYCHKLAKYLFSPESLHTDFNLVQNPVAKQCGIQLQAPSDHSDGAIRAYITNFTEHIPLAYIGLEDEIVKLVHKGEVKTVLEKVCSILT